MKILSLFCPFTVPPKHKYVILAHVGSETLMFVINSEINEFTRNRKWLLKSQVKLVVSDENYSFLDHDSYASCDRARNEMSFDEIFEQVENDINLIMGELTKSTTKEIIKVVKYSTTISKSHKESIITSLEESLK